MVGTAKPVLLEAREINKSARVLARAFHDDPGVVWIMPHEGRRRRLLRWNFEVFLRYGRRFGETYCPPETLEAAAIWLPPSEPYFSVRRLARLGYLTGVFKLDPWALIRQLATMSRLDRLHRRDVRGPHWYLAVLGVDPPRQGQGVGGSIIQPVLRRADIEGLPCYLETGKEIDVRFYRKHGFEVLEEGDLPLGGPRYWTMLREPARERPSLGFVSPATA
jgi:ribosomal protein S18 acetylase RimI-like enzyme